MEDGPRVSIERARLEELERLALLGRATAGFAHELKNGLMVTHGFAALARQLALKTEGVPPRLATHVAEVESQAHALVGQLQSFLALARGTNEVEPRRPLQAVVDEVVRLLRPLANQQELGFEHAIEPGAQVAVADPAFRSAILNVALNAIDFARSRVRLALSRDGEAWVLTIDDDGPGLDPALAARIFEPFVTGRREGTGLGLAQAKAAVEAEGGTIGARASALGGACFEVRLPARPTY